MTAHDHIHDGAPIHTHSFIRAEADPPGFAPAQATVPARITHVRSMAGVASRISFGGDALARQKRAVEAPLPPALGHLA